LDLRGRFGAGMGGKGRGGGKILKRKGKEQGEKKEREVEGRGWERREGLGHGC